MIQTDSFTRCGESDTNRVRLNDDLRECDLPDTWLHCTCAGEETCHIHE